MRHIADGFLPNPSGKVASVLGLLLAPLIAACASVPLEPAGSLSSYQSLTASDGMLTHARVRVDKDEVLAAKTILLVPTSFAATAIDTKLSDAQRKLVANVIDRALCIGLSDRFQIVSLAEGADLTVHASVTRIIPTDETAAAASKVTSLAVTAASAAGALTVPVPSMRVPIGLGGLALEAEAADRTGAQKAAIMWARGADAFTTRARVSLVGDAYELGSSFGDDFSKLLVTGASPFKTLPTPPPMHRVNSMLGGAPKESVCETYGRGSGAAGFLGGAIGLPPEWTDKGGAADAQPAK
jgi:Protein of unknown function (DUF3313)